ncbi:MAG: hypothetical protein JWR80_9459 [Bradyrhizobium sp.]|nr:hypothetical protein [Bradyrhizobium sp.]
MMRTLRQSTGRAHDWDQDKLNRIRHAQMGSDLAIARLQGMKVRAGAYRLTSAPPQAAVGSFPYPPRTCAEWTRFEAMTERKAGQ